MATIITEHDWLTCDEPQEMSYYERPDRQQHRFRWLAVTWGQRIRHIFESYDVPWFDACSPPGLLGTERTHRKFATYLCIYR